MVINFTWNNCSLASRIHNICTKARKMIYCQFYISKIGYQWSSIYSSVFLCFDHHWNFLSSMSSSPDDVKMLQSVQKLAMRLCTKQGNIGFAQSTNKPSGWRIKEKLAKRAHNHHLLELQRGRPSLQDLAKEDEEPGNDKPLKQ